MDSNSPSISYRSSRRNIAGPSLLLSETVDHGSHIPLEDAVRAVSDTNTVIYSFAFSSTKTIVEPKPKRDAWSR